jgi:hypothetical protein
VSFHSLLGVKEKLIRENTGEFGVFFSQTSQKLFIFATFFVKSHKPPCFLSKRLLTFFAFSMQPFQ